MRSILVMEHFVRITSGLWSRICNNRHGWYGKNGRIKFVILHKYGNLRNFLILQNKNFKKISVRFFASNINITCSWVQINCVICFSRQGIPATFLSLTKQLGSFFSSFSKQTFWFHRSKLQQFGDKTIRWTQNLKRCKCNKYSIMGRLDACCILTHNRWLIIFKFH